MPPPPPFSPAATRIRTPAPQYGTKLGYEDPLVVVEKEEEALFPVLSPLHSEKGDGGILLVFRDEVGVGNGGELERLVDDETEDVGLGHRSWIPARSVSRFVDVHAVLMHAVAFGRNLGQLQTPFFFSLLISGLAIIVMTGAWIEEKGVGGGGGFYR